MSAQEARAFALELLRANRAAMASRAKVEAERERRLQHVLAALCQTRAHQGRRYQRLQDVPPTEKAAFVASIERTTVDAAVSDSGVHAYLSSDHSAAYLGHYWVAVTSGTSGQIGVFLDDGVGWARQRAIVFARMFRDLLKAEGFLLLLKRRYRLAFVIGTGRHALTQLLASRIPALGRVVMQSFVHSIETPMPMTVAALNAQAPHLLHTYPTFLEVLCGEKAAGRLTVSPEIITVGSEPVSARVRALVRAVFPRARLVETYAATECLAMASTCPHGRLHINEDACILEPVTEDGRPVPLGERSDRVLVTNLLNVQQPVVRYTLTDSVVVSDEPCPCGTSFRSLVVFGRADDTIYLLDESGQMQSHPPIPWEFVFLGLPHLVQYQLTHVRQNVLRVAFVVDNPAHAQALAQAIDTRIAAYLAAHQLLTVVDFAIEEIASLREHGRGVKLRQISSAVPKPEGTIVPASLVRQAAATHHD